MRKFIIILILAFAGWQLAQSQNTVPAFRFIWNESNYLFYDTYDIKQLSFEYSCSDKIISDASTKSNVIDRVELSNGRGIMYFKSNPLPSEIRKFAEKAGFADIYVNNTRIITSTLLDKTEISKEVDKGAPKVDQFDSKFNKQGTYENIKFNIDFYSSKIYSMKLTDFPYYLYSGYIAEYTDQLNCYRSQLHNFNSK